MQTTYRVPFGDAESEFTEKRSRFISHLWRVETEAEARQHIEETKKTYYDARHNCWCYLIQEGGVVRYSDHWGSEVASCDWYLDGVARCSFDDHDGWRCGFAPWTEFELKTFEVTVYHPDLLPSESAAALGDPVRSGVAPAWRPGMADIPYASYRVRPDMIVDGCVVVAGTYGDCGTPFDGRCLMSVDVSDWTEEERAAWTEAFPADPVFPSLPDMFGDDYGRCR